MPEITRYCSWFQLCTHFVSQSIVGWWYWTGTRWRDWISRSKCWLPGRVWKRKREKNNSRGFSNYWSTNCKMSLANSISGEIRCKLLSIIELRSLQWWSHSSLMFKYQGNSRKRLEFYGFTQNIGYSFMRPESIWQSNDFVEAAK